MTTTHNDDGTVTLVLSDKHYKTVCQMVSVGGVIMAAPGASEDVPALSKVIQQTTAAILAGAATEWEEDYPGMEILDLYRALDVINGAGTPGTADGPGTPPTAEMTA